MRINEINGLFVAYNHPENFRILVCAQDKEEAMELAVEYFFEGNFPNHDPDNIEISEFSDVNTHFDCDYVIA